MLAKAVALKVSPGNEVATPRSDALDYADNSNASKPRSEGLTIETDDIPEFMLEQLSEFVRQEQEELCRLLPPPSSRAALSE